MKYLTREQIAVKLSHPDYITPGEGEEADAYPYHYETATLDQAVACELLVQSIQSWYEDVTKPNTGTLSSEIVTLGLLAMEHANPALDGISDTDTRECVFYELWERGVLIESYAAAIMFPSDIGLDNHAHGYFDFATNTPAPKKD